MKYEQVREAFLSAVIFVSAGAVFAGIVSAAFAVPVQVDAAFGSISYGGKVRLVMPPDPATCPVLTNVMVIDNKVKGGIPVLGLYVAPGSKLYDYKRISQVGIYLVGKYNPAPQILCRGIPSFPIDFSGTSK